jgi:hypothetical protein
MSLVKREIDTLFAEVGRMDVEVIRFEHQLDDCAVAPSSSINRTRTPAAFSSGAYVGWAPAACFRIAYDNSRAWLMKSENLDVAGRGR